MKLLCSVCAGALVAALLPATAAAQAGTWRSHDMSRPKPPVVAPPAPLTPPRPPGAVVLFDGTDLSAWTSGEGRPAAWKVGDGYFEVAPGTGPIRTREGFGDVHLHLEWAAPTPPQHTGQDRGNSGAFLMGRYEVQILDSYRSDTYADGQAAALYGQFPPRFNASRAPGEWQSYDIFFRRPRFGDAGQLLEPARVTVLHNGVLVQNNEELRGPTSWLKHLPYSSHPDRLPLELQDHGSPVRFRNVWVLPLPELPQPVSGAPEPAARLPQGALDRLVGRYDRPGQQAPITITRQGDRLFADFFWRPGALELVPRSATEFDLLDTDGRVVFELDRRGRPTGLVFHLGGASMPARRAP